MMQEDYNKEELNMLLALYRFIDILFSDFDHQTEGREDPVSGKKVHESTLTMIITDKICSW